MNSPVENVTSFKDYMKNGIPITPYIYKETLSDRFPMISKKGISMRNLLKRVLHFYLETNIRDNSIWF
ncbi:hypothetical protein F0365_13565 [Nonlabens sp. Ci31]|uniref:hypothetical protein n=1 Tax=Nonlabens sp. Ci31 TaxID=2608253 RepID=UPI001462B2F1|nr:hypothetical protein [Nonlabens sp. Ci31]QJP35353.1 hypothetical protein F0365_13565 [Nonlabens sp. Ci31]